MIHNKLFAVLAFVGLACVGTVATTAWGKSCDGACLAAIGDQYRAAYVAHDKSKAPFAKHVRFTEDAVELAFPDGSWDVVTSEVGPALTFTDPLPAHRWNAAEVAFRGAPYLEFRGDFQGAQRSGRPGRGRLHRLALLLNLSLDEENALTPKRVSRHRPPPDRRPPDR